MAIRAVVRLLRTHPGLATTAHRVASRLAARHRVGALAVVLDDDGRVLLVRHALRAPGWALPGGWVRRHEEPADAVVREVREETGLQVDAVAAVACEGHGTRRGRRQVSGVTIAYLCRPSPGSGAGSVRLSAELTDAAWTDVGRLPKDMTAFDAGSVREAAVRVNVRRP